MLSKVQIQAIKHYRNASIMVDVRTKAQNWLTKTRVCVFSLYTAQRGCRLNSVQYSGQCLWERGITLADVRLYMFTGIGHSSNLPTRLAIRQWQSWNGAAAQATLEKTALVALRLAQTPSYHHSRAPFKDPDLGWRVSHGVTTRHQLLGQGWR